MYSTSKGVVLISSDIDTLESIYKGHDCRHPEGYTYEEFEIGLRNFHAFLDGYAARSTLFMVGKDLERVAHHGLLRELDAEGHEIASHSYSHPQDFRLLSPQKQEEELCAMEKACESVVGKKPVGFRSPGWNAGDETLDILRRRGYQYDSSIFPTLAAPLLKFLHWATNSQRGSEGRSTMGQWNYMFAPTQPYRTSEQTLARAGESTFFEVPVGVSPRLRLPLTATFLTSFGMGYFKFIVNRLAAVGQVIHFQYHLSDFVDYRRGSLAAQTPRVGKGVYVPQALQMPLPLRMALFRQAMDTLAEYGRFSTILGYLAEKANGQSSGVA